jgi:hypothetical protein
MFFSLVLLALIASGGFALTYLVSDEEPFMWRVCAGSIIGSAVYSLLVFVAACGLGFTPAVLVITLIISMLPLLLFRNPVYLRRFKQDWARARGKLSGVTGRKAGNLIYYLFFFILFWYFFYGAVYLMPDGGLYTGASQNLGDLSFHLGAIFGFTETPSFPPQNPSWAGAKFSYPFMCDLLSACLIKLGLDFKDVIHAQDFTWAFALLVVIERFTVKLTNNRLAGKIAPAILFLTGGLGFVWFFKDFNESGKALFDFLAHLPKDYTIGDEFRWGNTMIVLFITQRGFLLGMPLTVVILQYFWKIFSAGESDETRALPDLKNIKALAADPIYYRPFLVGLLAGTLPLIHLHSLAALFFVVLFLMAIRPAKWLQWMVFGLGVVIIAVPELLWSISGSATETTKFFGWHFGWDKRDNSFLWFWFKNTGLTIPAILAGLYLFWTRAKPEPAAEEGEEPVKKLKKKKKLDNKASTPFVSPDWARTLLLFYLPFAFLFLLTNVVKLAPWEWDNIKVMIYWFIGSIPFIAYLLAWAWQKSRGWQIAAGACFAALIMAGSLDVWRVAAGQMKNGVFNADSIKVAELIRQKTPANALFLNGTSYKSTVLLSGRQSLMRYPGHLGSYGIDYGPREADVKAMYKGGPNAEALFQKYNIDYVVVGPEEKETVQPNEEYFKKFTVIAESGQYRVYKIKS